MATTSTSNIDWYSGELSKVLSFLSSTKDNKLESPKKTVKNELSYVAREQEQHRKEEEKKIFKTSQNKICSKCGTSETPLWRRGENKSILCNKCGLLYRRICKKESTQDGEKKKKTKRAKVSQQTVSDSSEDEQHQLPVSTEDVMAVASEVLQTVNTELPQTLEMSSFPSGELDYQQAYEIQKWLEQAPQPHHHL